MRQLEIENYIIDKPIIDILYDIQGQLTNGKLKDIKPQGDYIMITCPVHSGGHEAHPDSGIYVGNDYSKGFGYIHCLKTNDMASKSLRESAISLKTSRACKLRSISQSSLSLK